MSGKPRPRVQTARSFQRFEPPAAGPDSPSRPRSNTVHTPSIALVPEARELALPPEEEGKIKIGDIFEASDHHEHESTAIKELEPGRPVVAQVETLEQLPIEIRSFTERFLKSLSVKSHAAPLTIDAIADLFQDFYIQAESHISTHIAALTTKLSRESLRDKSPAPSISSRTSISSKGHQKGGGLDDDGGDQQMLTASEITGKRKARRQLELQRAALEEAVERGLCEKVYDKIYRHRSTDDEEKDAKLRSKTAALSLVGVGLKELHVNIPEPREGGADAIARLQLDIYNKLAPARASLQRMDQERYPLGKLNHLTSAHQSIVETLAQVFPSTSSADEVLPTLIYTLITSPPESLNVASNLHFIQLFRANVRMDGEAAYCLVNLEAAISFLETVDLSSLRTEDLESRPADALGVASGSDQPRLRSLTADLPAVSNPDQKADDPESPTPDSPAKPKRPFQDNQRRISYMLQAQAERIEASRETFINSADQAFDSINSTLEHSMKFLFGRLKEQEKESQHSPVIIPKTLDDARRLVKSPIQEEDEEHSAAATVGMVATVSDDPLGRPDEKLLGMVAGRRQTREQSVDSNRSGGSNKRSSFFGGDEKSVQGPAEAVGNFVNALNPLSRFGVGVPSFPKFGRGASGQVPDQTMAEKPLASPTTQRHSRDGSGNAAQVEVDLNAVEALAQLRKAKPPIRKFMDVRDAKELKVGDIEDLLRDYKRLASLLGEAIAS
ncbi:hypothetical protein CAC42_2718 [Sphaceloma murrayae]|uniref:VPS9 domain-containing protein n=1 Tax=Sphaceloma murrayae TaxID=2082308 RepID=A0A2K1R0H2_9PEZI|nr:hypothetical protein CAC42_2718 [Sphaceloma murrayae]